MKKNDVVTKKSDQIITEYLLMNDNASNNDRFIY